MWPTKGRNLPTSSREMRENYRTEGMHRFVAHPFHSVFTSHLNAWRCVQLSSLQRSSYVPEDREVERKGVELNIFYDSFIHSIGMCRMRRFLAVFRSFFHSSLLYALSFHPFPPTSHSSSLTSSWHPFLGLPLSLVVSKFIYNISLENSVFFHSLYMSKPIQSI